MSAGPTEGRAVPKLSVRALGLGCAALGVLWGLAFGTASPAIVFLVAAGVFFAVFVSVTATVQWTTLFVLVALVPLGYMRGVPKWMKTITPWSVLLVVIAVCHLLSIREAPDTERPSLGAAGVLGGACLVWGALSVTQASPLVTSAAWGVSFVSLVALPVVIARFRPEGVARLRGAWAIMGGVLGAYALCEALLLHRNPLSAIYAGGGPGAQTWGMYRATTTLGHPLNNGMFFSIAFVLALERFFAGASRVHLLLAALSFGGVLATGSRGAVLAMGPGFVIVTVGALLRRGRGRGRARRRVSRALVFAVVAVGTVPIMLSGRLESHEAAQSGAFRVRQIPVAFDAMAASPWFGTGPGLASDHYASLLRGIGGAGAFESYWLEMGVGTGVVGLALGVTFFAAVLVRCARVLDAGGAAIVVAWLLNATSVNAFEGTRSEQFFLGFVLTIALSYPRAPVWWRRRRGGPEMPPEPYPPVVHGGATPDPEPTPARLDQRSSSWST